MSYPQKTIGRTHSWKETPKLLNLALLNVYQGKITQSVGLIIHLITKFQILALYFKFSMMFLPRSLKPVSDIINTIANILIFKDLFTFTKESIIAQVAFCILQLYNIILMGISLFLFIRVIRRKHINERLQSFWALLIYVHCLILIFPSFNFNVAAIIYWARDDLAIFNLNATNQIIVPLLSFLTLLWNLFLIIFSQMFLLTSLQANGPLHLKTTSIQRLEIAEKCLLFLLCETILDTEISSWVILIISFLLVALKTTYVLRLLPYYNIQIQTYDVIMNSILISLSFLNLLAKAILRSKHSLGSSEVIIAWLLFCPFAVKFFWNRLELIYSTLLRTPITDTRPGHLLHRIPLYRVFLGKKVDFNQHSEKVDFINLYIKGKNKIMKPYTKENGEQVEFDLTEEQHFKMYSLSLLRDCIKLHNNYWPLKVAYIRMLIEYAYFVQALYFIEQTRKGSLSITKKTILHLLKSEIENILMKKYQNKKSERLNLMIFLHTKYLYDKLRTQIVYQIQKQQSFWTTYSHTKIDFKTLVDYSNEIDLSKQKIKQLWNQYENAASDNFVSPYLTYGVYLELVNNRPTLGTDIINQYLRKAIVVEKVFGRDELSNDTIFAADNVSIEISGIKETLGTILECSHSVKKVFGFARDHIIGLNVSIVVPDWLKAQHNHALFRYYETGTKTVLNHTRQVLAMTSSGYLLSIHIHVRLNPFLENKISYVGLLKPMKQKMNFIIVLPDGTIDGLTKEIAEELNILPNSKINMAEICSDFKTINEVTNRIAQHEIVNRKNIEILFLDLDEVNKKSPKKSKELVNHRTTIQEDTTQILPTTQSDRRHLVSKRTGNTPRARRSIVENFSKILLSKSAQSFNYETCVQLYSKYKDEGIEVILYSFQNNKQGSSEVVKQFRAHIRIENMIAGHDWAKVIVINEIIDRRADRSSSHYRKNVTKPVDLESQNSLPSRHDGDKTKKYQQIYKNRKDVGASAISRLKVSSRSSIEGDDPVPTVSPFKLNFSKLSAGDLDISPMKSPRFCKEEPRGKLEKNSLTNRRRNNSTSWDDINGHMLSQREGKDNSFLEIKSREMDINTARDTHAFINNEDDNLSQKEKKAERLNNNNFTHVNGPNSTYGRFIDQGTKSKVQKGLEQAIEYKYRSRKFKYFTLAFILCMLLFAVALLAQMLVAINAFNDISDQTNIINLATQRLYSVILTNLIIRVWHLMIEGKLGNIPDSAYVSIMKARQQTLTPEIDLLSVYNRELMDAVTLLNEDLQKDFYERDIRVYEVYGNGTLGEFTMDNTFTAIQKMLSKAYRFIAAESYPRLQPNLDMLYFLHNCYNDLYIASEHSVSILSENLLNKVSLYQGSLMGISSPISISLLLFLLSSLVLMSKIKKSVYDFGVFFFKISDNDIHRIKSSLNNFHKALVNNYQDEALLSQINSIDEHVKEEDEELQSRPNQKDAVYKGYHRQNRLLILRLWPLVLLVIGLFVGFIGMKLSNIDNIQELHNQNLAAGSNMLIVNLMVSIEVEMVGANLATTIKNQPILDQFRIALEEISQTDALVRHFEDNDGRIEPNKRELLFNFSCNAQFEGRFVNYKDACLNISANQGYISIIDINNKVRQAVDDFISVFLSSNRTFADQVNFLGSSFKIFPNLLALSRQLNTELLRRVLVDFQSFLKSEIANTVWVSVTFECLIVMISLYSFPWALTKLNGKDYELRKLLKLVPINIVAKNRWLKTYLINHSNRMLDTLRNALDSFKL